MSVAYFDCYSGVAGDMVLGALVDAGLPVAKLKRELAKLPLKSYSIRAVKDARGGISGTNVMVGVDLKVHGGIKHVRFDDIIRMIGRSRLSKGVCDVAIRIFDCLAAAEARIHSVKKGSVCFHEVGAVDSIIDIVGAAIGFDHFKFDRIHSSPLPVTRGFVKCAHGKLPVPAPATLEILKGVPLEPAPVKAEIVTPTGAAILKTMVDSFGGNPVRKVEAIGYGCGDAHFKGIPNALRLIIGEGGGLIAIEANIDDMNPEFYDHIISLLMNAGAIDVTLQHVWMKKRRPGVLVRVLCGSGARRCLTDIILREATTLGVRYYPVDRETLERETLIVKVAGASVRVKLGLKDRSIYNIEPEYDDCRRAALSKKIPLKEVFQRAIVLARRKMRLG